jgi:hypothetical protein
LRFEIHIFIGDKLRSHWLLFNARDFHLYGCVLNINSVMSTSSVDFHLDKRTIVSVKLIIDLRFIVFMKLLTLTAEMS